MTMIEQTEKTELRDLSFEEMEQVSGGEFMMPTEWITSRIVAFELAAAATGISRGPLR
jgi:hypothetical protein